VADKFETMNTIRENNKDNDGSSSDDEEVKYEEAHI